MKNSQRLVRIKLPLIHRHKIISLIFMATLSISSCDDQDKIKHINSFPRWNNSLVKPNEVYLFFAKDLGQAIFAEDEHRPVQSPKQMPAVLKVGGLSTIGSYLKIAKEQFGDQSLLISGPPKLVNSNSIEKNKLILDSLDQIPIDATLLSHHELITSTKIDTTPQNINWLNSNIIAIKTGEAISTWKSLNYRVFQKAGINIGLVGITDFENISEDQKQSLKGQYFKGAATALLKLKAKLKSAQSNFNILIYNGDNSCKRKVPFKTIAFSDIEKDSECLKGSSLESLISKLPPRLIHLVVITKGQYTRGKLLNIPILGNPDGPQFLSSLKLSFDELGGLDEDNSLFIAPVKYCEKIFAGLEDCQYSHENSDIQRTRIEHLQKTAFGLIQARFLGREVRKNDLIDAIINGTVKTQSQDK